ncbi:MAG: putative toxin-antitoxin system toxin component, PIN family [Caldilineaceae bacterium]|nr:putative toxin-antitoxin system toxin component, PIN family [Caldilineaceae bacterium]
MLDTNQLVAALVRPPELATFLMAWASARFTVIASQALVDEYLRVLDYPEISTLIPAELRRTFHTHLLHDIELVEPAETSPICRDPDDDKVIAAAIYGLVDYLVTVDKDLLTHDIVTMLSRLGIKIISGDALIYLLDQSH